MKFRRRLFTSTINCKQFHVIVIQKQQRNFTRKYGTRVKLLFCLLNLSLLFSFFSFFFFYVLVAIASSDRKVDPLKNKRCWNQSLVLFNLLLCQLVVLSRSYRQSDGSSLQAIELPFEYSFPSFIVEVPSFRGALNSLQSGKAFRHR